MRILFVRRRRIILETATVRISGGDEKRSAERKRWRWKEREREGERENSASSSSSNGRVELLMDIVRRTGKTAGRKERKIKETYIGSSFLFGFEFSIGFG